MRDFERNKMFWKEVKGERKGNVGMTAGIDDRIEIS